VKYRSFGKTGIRVSEIGFGTWGLGGNSYGPVDDAVSIRALRRAFDEGITFYDTSDLYGDGHSEEVLGEALEPVRGEVVICSKVGLLPHTGFEMPCDFSPAHIREGLEASLKRLRTDYLDIYLLHSPELEMLRDGAAVDTLLELRREGKIRSFGISARSPDDALAAIREFGFQAAQVNFNLIDQRAIENGLFELAQERGVGIVARTPLCFGYLTGKLTGKERFIGQDHRANWPADQLKRWAQAADLFNFLDPGGQRSAVQLALRFCLHHDSVSTVIPGMMNEAEVLENVTASELSPLSDGELERIRLAYASDVFYDKNAKNKENKP
jgi:aryl-alcohol dehydrogenase-like predicted oxidoreductase